MLRAQGSGVKAIIYVGKLLPNEYDHAVERTVSGPREREFFIGNLPVRIHCII